MPPRRDAREEYAVQRAQWLYARLVLAADAGESAKARVLAYRLTRWLATADRGLVAEYYWRLADTRAVEQTLERQEKSDQRARERGYAVLEMARAAEIAETAEAEEAGDGDDAEVEVP